MCYNIGNKHETVSIMFDIWNRRYTGSKYKLSSWISELIAENCKGNSFCDIFAGTGIISYSMLEKMKKIYINDFLPIYIYVLICFNYFIISFIFII